MSTAVLTLALVGGGGGAVIAANGGGNGNGDGDGNGAANSQYCPPKSPGAGKPKNPPPGNACGQPNQGNPVRTAPDQDRGGGDRDDGPSTGNRADDADAEGGYLPFTGLFLLALVAAGLALIIAGRTLRGRTQR